MLKMVRVISRGLIILRKAVRSFARDIGLWAIAILCGIGLWLVVAVRESKIDYFPGNLTMEIKNTPWELAAICNERQVRVRLQASYEAWRQLNIDHLRAEIDLTGLDEGTHEVDVDVKVDLPDVRVIDKEPSRVMVRLESIVEKEVPIRVVVGGKVGTGFVPVEPKVEPEKVVVRGAKSLIDEISQVRALVELAGENRDFKKRVPVFLDREESDESTNGVVLMPKSVQVLVRLVLASGTKVVGIKAKITGQPQPNYYIERIEVVPATTEITSLTGALPSVASLETEEISIEGIKQNLERDVALLPQANVTAAVKTVRVRVALAPNTVERQIAASFDYQLEPGTRVVSIEPVRVTISGPAKTIEKLTSDQVRVVCNLVEKEAGIHWIEVTKEMFSTPDDCAVVSWLPTSVAVDLRELVAHR